MPTPNPLPPPFPVAAAPTAADAHTRAVDARAPLAVPVALPKNVAVVPYNPRPMTMNEWHSEPPEGSAPQPVQTIVWVHRDALHANGYNPNHVAKTELELLALSIKEDKWTQPIVARHDGEIVDGFHRWTVSSRVDVGSLTGYFVPVVFLPADKSEADQMLSTIRHNRARGQHGVLAMARIVRGVQETHGLSQADVETRLGMEAEEVERLSDHAGMPVKIARGAADFGEAFGPEGTRL